MQVRENEKFTREYYEADKRHIGNAVQVFFKDGTSTERIEVNFPVGHRKRRAEGIPLLVAKFEQSVAAHYPAAQAARIVALFKDAAKLDAMPVRDLQAALVTNA